MKNTKSAPASLACLRSEKLNKIHVLKFNEKKSKPDKPVVDCKCLTSGKPFSVKAYHVKYQTAKYSICVRIGKAPTKHRAKDKPTVGRIAKRWLDSLFPSG